MSTPSEPRETSVGSKTVILDVARIPVTGNGVGNFYWPISPNETLAMRDEFISGLVSCIRKLETGGSSDGKVLTILFVHVLLEAMAYYRASALTRRARDNNHTLKQVSIGRLTNLVTEGRPRGAAPLLQQLKGGPPKPSQWRMPVRVLKNMMTRDGIVRRQKLKSDISDDVVTISISPLLALNANLIDDEVSYYSPHHWFGKISDTDAEHIDAGIQPETQKEILSILAVAFSTGGEPLPKFLSDAFDNFLSSSSGMVMHHLQPLLEKIPPFQRGSGVVQDRISGIEFLVVPFNNPVGQ
jgi:hypothetical protein